MDKGSYIFISYSAKEYPRASFVRQVLEKNGVPCFLAPDSLKNPDGYSGEVPDAIRGCGAFLLILSPASQRSEWVQTELDLACKLQKTTIAFDINDCTLTDDFNFLLAKSIRIAAYEEKAAAFCSLVTLCREQLGLPPLDDPTIPDFSKEDRTKQRRKKQKRIFPLLLITLIAAAAIGFFVYVQTGVEKGVSGEYIWEYNAVFSTLTVSANDAASDTAGSSEDTWDRFADSAGTVTITQGVRSVGDHAFADFTAMHTLSLPNSLKTIGSGAFSGCSALQSVTVPADVAVIEDNAFFGCAALVSVAIPDTVTEIGTSAFEGCVSLRSLDLPRDLLTIGERAFFGCEELSKLDMSKRVQEIGAEAFCDCIRLKSINIYDSVGSIGDHAVGYHTGDDGKQYVTDTFVIVIQNGSAGERYAMDNGLHYRYLY